MSIVFLKVKIKSLAAEASIIRKEERKAKANSRWLRTHTQHTDEHNNREYIKARHLFFDLKDHRKHPVGTESRAALIAYGYLRGRKYKIIEQPKEPLYGPIVNRVHTLINKYGNTEISREELGRWLSE